MLLFFETIVVLLMMFTPLFAAAHLAHINKGRAIAYASFTIFNMAVSVLLAINIFHIEYAFGYWVFSSTLNFFLSRRFNTEEKSVD